MAHVTTDKQAQLFKALMHPVRIQILEILRGGEACVCHIEAMLGLRQAYVSQQLAVLRRFDLIKDRRDGSNIYYRVIRREVFDMLDTARAIVGDEEEPAPRWATGCSCPRCVPHIARIE
ncbi:MAG: ArsR family transcriptional regulator [Roseiflexus castenholzii]|uniref:ArsR/SmtB family transcription factor n=1 Tax=Roseiflexus castenholzii TaxID=120962 RepID=UPI000CBE607B|nr:MAG: ArsR family transcriptional regulator [Roseiflexus castenholzii]